MDVPIIKFDSSGKSLSAEVTSLFAQPGSYTLLLWEADSNDVIFEKKGNFINSDDDCYRLPGTAAVNHKRVVEATVTLAMTPPTKDYKVKLTIYQGGTKIGEAMKQGKTDETTHSEDLFIQLIKA